MDLLRFVPGYQHDVYNAGKEPLLLLLLGFLVTFALTRAYTRIARVRGWGSAHVGGVHMHHVVPGVLVLICAGTAEFAFDPTEVYSEFLAIAFGCGIALVLDEFAMVLHLEDVYWSPEGRGSVDAIVFMTVIILFLFTATAPFGAEDNGTAAGLWVGIAVSVVIALVAFLKGKLKLAILSVVFPLFGVIGATRLAKPESWWARRFYAADGSRWARRKNSKAIARAESRQRRWDRWQLRLYDLIGGAPTESDE